MEALTHHGQTMDNLLSRARSQVGAVEALSRVLAAEKEGLRRLAWAAQLDAVRDQVKREVEVEQTEECIARTAFNKGKMIDSLWGFGVGVIIAWTKQTNDEPLVAGLRQVDYHLRRTAPFGTIMILVGSRSLFGDVRVLSISRMAREQWRRESDVVATIRAKGSDLMTPEVFFRLIEDRRQKILIGPTKAALMLPAPGQQPGNEHAEHRQTVRLRVISVKARITG